MSEASSTFDSLWIIESLKDGDLKTGRNLFESQLQHARLKHPDLTIHFKQPASAADLFALLGEISEQAANGAYPMLHFECHGRPVGLETSDGDTIDWETIRLPLISINEHCRLNLVVVVAACNGAHLIETANHLDRAPFWAVIGPNKEVTSGVIQRDFGAFYETYFETLSGDKAVAALNRDASHTDRVYQFISIEGLFKRAYADYHKNHCLGRARQERIEHLLSLAMAEPDISTMGLANVRKTVKTLLSDSERHFDRIKQRFFFLDKHPDNARRFTTSFADIADYE